MNEMVEGRASGDSLPRPIGAFHEDLEDLANIDSFAWSWMPCWWSFSRTRRAWATEAGTSSSQRAAAVAGRGE